MRSEKIEIEIWITNIDSVKQSDNPIYNESRDKTHYYEDEGRLKKSK